MAYGRVNPALIPEGDIAGRVAAIGANGEAFSKAYCVFRLVAQPHSLSAGAP